MIQKIGGGQPPAELPTDDSNDLPLLWALLNSCWALDPIERPSINNIHGWITSNNAKILSALQAAS